MALTQRQEAFAVAVVKNGGDKVAAYKEAGYSWKKLNKNSLSVNADKLYNSTNVLLRINELKEVANKAAEDKFKITIEQRLKWLKEITEAGIAQYVDGNGSARRENLAAARAAIATMNDMLGVSDSKTESKKSFNITLKVEDASSPE